MDESWFDWSQEAGVRSRFRRDDRAQSVWIGFVLLLALLLLLLAGYQTYSVPAQNSDTEFQHNQEVQDDMVALSNSLLSVRGARDGAAVSEHRPVRIRLGTSYRTRVLTVNPPPPAGSLNARDRGPVSISGANTAGSFQGDPQGTLLDADHDTRLLVYQPNYNEYDAAPTTRFEHSLLYNRFETANRTVRDQRTVRGGSHRLNVVLFEGDVAESGRRVTLDPETLDGPTAPVPIEPAAGETFELTLPTDAPQLWASQELIGEAFDEGEPDARVVGTDTTSVTIELRGQWDLQMTRVGFDGGQATEEFSGIKPIQESGGAGNRTYQVRWDRDAIAATQGVDYDPATDTVLIDETVDTIQAPVFVRERATGDPIENATLDPGTANRSVVAVEPQPARTDADGRTTVELSPGSVGTATLFATSGDHVDSLAVSVVDSGGTGGDGPGSYVPGSLSFPGNGNGIEFGIEFSEAATVTEASVDTSTMPDGVRFDLGTVRIDGTNRATASYDSDGSTIPLDPTTVQDPTTIEFRTFSSGGQGALPGDPTAYTASPTEPTGPHVALRLQFDDGTETLLYFEYTP